MNVFPSRPKFNIKIFGFFVILFSLILIALTIIFIPVLSGLFIFFFLMWGFMFLNPYTIYYLVKKKQFCPRCYHKVAEKNLEYQPFGKKEPAIFGLIAPVKKSIEWHCPYCGNSLTEDARFCGSCGKEFEIKE
ncbi:MAG: zinc ribbon domain-containing protein [Candidatus Hermodarchaeota archaeon]